ALRVRVARVVSSVSGAKAVGSGSVLAPAGMSLNRARIGPVILDPSGFFATGTVIVSAPGRSPRSHCQPLDRMMSPRLNIKLSCPRLKRLRTLSPTFEAGGSSNISFGENFATGATFEVVTTPRAGLIIAFLKTVASAPRPMFFGFMVAAPGFSLFLLIFQFIAPLGTTTRAMSTVVNGPAASSFRLVRKDGSDAHDEVN